MVVRHFIYFQAGKLMDDRPDGQRKFSFRIEVVLGEHLVHAFYFQFHGYIFKVLRGGRNANSFSSDFSIRPCNFRAGNNSPKYQNLSLPLKHMLFAGSLVPGQRTYASNSRRWRGPNAKQSAPYLCAP